MQSAGNLLASIRPHGSSVVTSPSLPAEVIVPCVSTGVVVGVALLDDDVGTGLLDDVVPLDESLDEQPAIASATAATAKMRIRTM